MLPDDFQSIHKSIHSCRACPKMVGPPVHGPAVSTPLFLLGQAPGPHEGKKGRPFAHTAGKTLFKWFEEATHVNEETFRSQVYMAAVARCYPGKAKSGGGDRVPDASEILTCSQHISRELNILQPGLILAVGRLAITQVLGVKRFGPSSLLSDVVGKVVQSEYLGHSVDVICLPHPSGLSSWPRLEPGKSLLKQALKLVHEHPDWRKVFRYKNDDVRKQPD